VLIIMGRMTGEIMRRMCRKQCREYLGQSNGNHDPKIHFKVVAKSKAERNDKLNKGETFMRNSG